MATVTPAVRSASTLTKVATDLPDYSINDSINPAGNIRHSAEGASIDVHPYDSASPSADDSIHKAEVHVRSPITV